MNMPKNTWSSIHTTITVFSTVTWNPDHIPLPLLPTFAVSLYRLASLGSFAPPRINSIPTPTDSYDEY